MSNVKVYPSALGANRCPVVASASIGYAWQLFSFPWCCGICCERLKNATHGVSLWLCLEV